MSERKEEEMNRTCSYSRIVLWSALVPALPALLGCVSYAKYGQLRDELARANRANEDLVRRYHQSMLKARQEGESVAVGAQVAVVSAACARRGLPNGEVLERVRRHGMAVWSTGRDGAVLASLGQPGAAIVVWGWAARPRCTLPGVAAAERARGPD